MAFNELRFWDWNTGGDMVTFNDGNVGIGTTTPGEKLDVNGHLRLFNGQTDGARLIWRGGSGGTQEYRARVFDDGTLGFFPIEDTQPGYLGEALRLFQDGHVEVSNTLYPKGMIVFGNVGIGTTTPGNILTVVNGSATDPIADAWTTYSSIRWKENITPITGALAKINLLNPVYFDWKKGHGQGHDLGFIAEEIGKVIPEVVAWEEDSIYAKSVDYGRLSALAIAGIKELDQNIAPLIEEIQQLKAENEKLKLQIENLQTQNNKEFQNLKAEIERMQKQLGLEEKAEK